MLNKVHYKWPSEQGFVGKYSECGRALETVMSTSHQKEVTCKICLSGLRWHRRNGGLFSE